MRRMERQKTRGIWNQSSHYATPHSLTVHYGSSDRGSFHSFPQTLPRSPVLKAVSRQSWCLAWTSLVSHLLLSLLYQPIHSPSRRSSCCPLRLQVYSLQTSYIQDLWIGMNITAHYESIRTLMDRAAITEEARAQIPMTFAFDIA